MNDEILTYDRLSGEQRAVAWAVVRAMATAMWLGLGMMLLVALLVSGVARHFDLWLMVPLAGTATFATILEVKSRDLERVDAA